MKITHQKDGTFRYCYRVSPGCSFALSLLCEVGEPWQPEARARVEAMGDVVTVELPYAPWLANARRGSAKRHRLTIVENNA